MISKGSRSTLAVYPEVTFGTYPVSAPYRGVMFSSETFGEQIDNLQSEDIRSDRATSALRGGNIAVDGGFTADLGLVRFAQNLMLDHLLGAKVTTAGAADDPLTDGMVAVRGEIYTIGGNHYIAATSGTYNKEGATAAADFSGFTSGTKTIGGIRWNYYGADPASTFPIHTWTGGTDIPTPGLSVEKAVLGGTENRYWMFSGGRVNSLELTIPQKGIIKAGWQMMFKRMAKTQTTGKIGNAGAYVYPTDDIATGFEAFIKIGSSTNRLVRDASLTISNNFDPEIYVVGSREREELPDGTRSLSGRFSTYFQDSVEYNYFKNETVIPITFQIITGPAILTITLNECKLTGDGVPKVTGPGALVADFNFTGFKQNQASDMTVVLKTEASVA